MKTSFSLEAVSPVRFTAAALAAAAVWLLVPELAQAAVTFGDIGQNVADSAKGVAKGVTMAGFASGAGMGVWGCIDLYKASKGQSGQTGNYAPGVAKVVIRNSLYRRMEPSEALRRLAARFPGGSAKAEVERRRRQVTDQSGVDDVLVNVIQEIVNEIAQAPRAS